MQYLLLTVILNALISAFLKWMDTYKVNALQAIVCNYWVCVITGSLFIGQIPFHTQTITQPWWPWALVMGAAFISLFNLMAFITKVDGITTTNIANKLSLIIPVAFSVLIYHDHLGLYNIAGIILAFPAVYFTVKVPEQPQGMANFWAPILLFLGSGLLDTLVKYTQFKFLHTADAQAIFLIVAFGVAGCIGLFVLLLQILRGKAKWQWRAVLMGILLGVPNYFSIYFLVRFLNSGLMQSAVAIPVNNLSIVVFTTLMAIILFKEKLNRSRLIGLALSVFAILLIALRH